MQRFLGSRLVTFPIQVPLTRAKIRSAWTGPGTFNQFVLDRIREFDPATYGPMTDNQILTAINSLIAEIDNLDADLHINGN